MSSEFLGQTKTAITTPLQSGVESSASSAKTVNINDLIAKVKKEKTKEKKESYLFIGVAVGLLAITGIVASF